MTEFDVRLKTMAYCRFLNMPLIEWVGRTCDKMRNAEGDAQRTWDAWKQHWPETYRELGGTKTSGEKNCPMKAGHCLWFLGRMKAAERTVLYWTMHEVLDQMGPNAVYALLALEILGEHERRSEDTRSWTTDELWQRVQSRYRQVTREKPAAGEQGAIRMVLGLFHEGQLTHGQSLHQ